MSEVSTTGMLLRALKLPGFAAHHEEVGRQAERDGWTFEAYLRHLLEIELGERRERKIQRLLKSSELPSDKTLATLDPERLPVKVKRQLPGLCEGGFVERAENVARFIEVNLNLMLDLPAESAQQWQPLVATTGDAEAALLVDTLDKFRGVS